MTPAAMMSPQSTTAMWKNSLMPIASVFSASIEAWPPGDDRTHTAAMILPFSREFDSRAEVVNVALAEARRQIDRVEGTPRE